jgi:hypothetical protein
MILQCMKCGWIQAAASKSVADVMTEDHLLDDLCEGRVARMEGSKR